jgi:hypothetical protein
MDAIEGRAEQAEGQQESEGRDRGVGEFRGEWIYEGVELWFMADSRGSGLRRSWW